ncbi:PfkB family carbohydrate kinase [Phocaeicola abscessus]|uniref:PfkB family carbohydrate kinase n=1 Tax=Phocaeicola abscessus TaxID=555313 RepID=UPI000386CF05|nr:PfkB family carbohydrate kinase [Phocaeicola abscessus]EPT33901.1 carbohydrate kinase, PfkB family [Bacteroidetes bacterium oral taxon 272 str. F0290]
MNDICCIGHITLDKIVTPLHITYLPGGTSYYFSHGISRLDEYKNYKLVTSLALSEMQAVEDIRAKGIKVKVIPSKETVYFENTYGIDQNNRTQRVLAKADPFKVEDLQDVEARIFHLGSLLSDDFPLDVIKYLSGKGILCVDVQGYLRQVQGDRVYAVDWPEKMKAFPYIDILKVNEFEMDVLTGHSDPIDAAKQLSGWGVKEVLVTLGSLGSIIYVNGQIYKIPAYPPEKIVDATGCGDTYATGYLYMRNKGASYEEAGCFAAAMSTLNQEVSGPFCGTEQDVLNIIRNSNLKPERL